MNVNLRRISIFCLMILLLSGFNMPLVLIEPSSWEIISDYDCEELHIFNEDQTISVSSGELKVVNGYLINEIDNSDFLSFQTIVVETNEKPDCLGERNSKIGNEFKFYIQFKSNRTEIHFYHWPSKDGYMNIFLKKLQ